MSLSWWSICFITCWLKTQIQKLKPAQTSSALCLPKCFLRLCNRIFLSGVLAVGISGEGFLLIKKKKKLIWCLMAWIYRHHTEFSLLSALFWQQLWSEKRSRLQVILPIATDLLSIGYWDFPVFYIVHILINLTQ